MFRLQLRWLMSALLCAAAAAAQSQPLKPALKPDPLDAGAKVPRLVYESSLLRYQRLSADEPVGWREANDKVGRIGGWRAYAREAQRPEAAASDAAAETAKPMHHGHGAEKKP